MAAGSADRASGSGAPLRVSDVVRDVVAVIAPEELPLVEGLSRLDDAAVMRRLTHGGRRREPLGFGLDEVAVLVSPVVWIAVEEVVRRIVDSAVTGGAKGSKTLLRKAFRRRLAPLAVPALTREQVAEVQQRVLELAAQRGLERERAMALADLLGARLAPQASKESPRRAHSGEIGIASDTQPGRAAGDAGTDG